MASQVALSLATQLQGLRTNGRLQLSHNTCSDQRLLGGFAENQKLEMKRGLRPSPSHPSNRVARKRHLWLANGSDTDCPELPVLA